jgi:nucleotide-binding universal stress UspA family protein
MGDAMIEIQRILCPIDFSDYSRRALDHAVAIARWYESAVTALHVFATAPVATYAAGTAVFELDQDQLLGNVKRFISADAAPEIDVDAMVREGNPASEILTQATDMNADLLVMGTHGRSGFERLLLGSITEKCCAKQVVRC